MGYDDWYDEDEWEEDDAYYEERRMDDDLWDDYEYDGVEYDLEYHRSLLNPIQLAWFDFANWVYDTRLYRKWSDWKWARKYRNNSEIPF